MALRVSSGEHSHPFDENIESSIDVPVMGEATVRTCPEAVAQDKSVVLVVAITSRTQPRRGKPSVYPNDDTSLTLCFILQIESELTMGCIAKGLRMSFQLGSRKSLDVQVLDADDIMRLANLVG